MTKTMEEKLKKLIKGFAEYYSFEKGDDKYLLEEILKIIIYEEKKGRL